MNNTNEPISAGEMERMIKAAITETCNAFQEFIEKHTVIKDSKGVVLPDAVLDLDKHPVSLMKLVYSKLEKHGIKITTNGK